MKTNLARKIEETAQATGLEVRCLSTRRELAVALQAGLAELYQDIFSRPPYCENFSVEEVKGIFEDCLNKKGFLFIAADKDSGRVVAFTVSLPLEQEKSLSAIFNGLSDPDKVAYFAEDGVAVSHRRRGISAHMKDLLLTANYSIGKTQVLLRTSATNYPQICAVTKAGGQVLPGTFQNVASRRSDGTITKDKRSFYMFSENDNVPVRQSDMLQRVSIVRPGGNDTAIVWDDVPEAEHKEISLRIQQNYPGIEQVMFVQRNEKGELHGQMAGGEFCGNATRSLGYLLLKDERDTAIFLSVSGTDQPMRVTKSVEGAATEIPVFPELGSVQKTAFTGEYIVDLKGISFFVTESNKEGGKVVLGSEEGAARDQKIMDLLRRHNLLDKPAAGIIVIERLSDGTLNIHPFVHVKSTGTLYYETACGSGTAAVGLTVARETGRSVRELKVRQPSGMSLSVSVGHTGKGFARATVGGPIEILFDGEMHLSCKPLHQVSCSPKR